MAGSGDAMFCLGIDGGGTGCRAVLADPRGHRLGEGRAGPANIVTDPDGALRSILAAAGAAMAGHCGPHQVVAVLGLAGAQIDGAAARIAAALPFRHGHVVQDLEIAVAGALGPHDGLVAVVGTGSAFARRQGGVLRTLGGWGLALGDEGSGAWIGRALCAEALRALDGRRALTPLLHRTLADHGGGAGLVAFARTARPAEYAALVPGVLSAAARGDAAAQALRQRAAAEVLDALAALQVDPPLPAVLTGGLGPRLLDSAPDGWVLAPAAGGPLEGALAMAAHILSARDTPTSPPRGPRPER
ncbi:BadF/BadG/BcrA/BcrD ATPase family protein [Rhodobaculum claviforme]|uniref:BadF/BadG/BcrA/BcrD ATPase family protein n=1 Tax=Rhodobaculum claviforme TaxID=1549854 RepID=UPI001911E91A